VEEVEIVPKTKGTNETPAGEPAKAMRGAGGRLETGRGKATTRALVGRARELSDLWEPLSARLDGKDVLKTQLKGAHLHFTNRGHFIVTVGDRVLWSGEARFRPDEGPQAIDIIHERGEFEGTVFRAIYEVDGETHRVCSAPPGGVRPREFESRKGTGRMLQVWRRKPGR
jgi:uncharacterized protein (TIGR03067 family)